MRERQEIITEIITSEGLKTWEAHTDKFNRMVAEKAMDTYAKQEAVAFAEHISKHRLFFSDRTQLWHSGGQSVHHKNNGIATPELYEKFKSEKP